MVDGKTPSIGREALFPAGQLLAFPPYLLYARRAVTDHPPMSS